MALPEELTKLLEAGVHFGHQAKRWNPKMRRFIFAKRSGIYIIDLEKTLEKLNEALKFIEGIVVKNGTILFVGTKKQAKNITKELAETSGMPYVIERWVGGLLTNFSTIKSRIDRYNAMLKQREEGRFENFVKKEVVMFNRALAQMDKTFAGLRTVQGLPDALFVFDPKKEILAVREAMKLGIPIIALVDTDGDPDILDYPIPGNDDAIKSIRIIASFVADVIQKGRAQVREETQRKNEAMAAQEETVKLDEKQADVFEEIEEKIIEEVSGKEFRKPKKS